MSTLSLCFSIFFLSILGIVMLDELATKPLKRWERITNLVSVLLLIFSIHNLINLISRINQ